jgi:hypothetical protein
MTLLRRFLLFQAFMLWQGGFLFYTSFVVPVGTRVLGSAEGQGRITARVTESLNVCGVVALALMLWDVVVRRGQARFVLWFVMAAIQAWLFHLHAELDARMDAERTFVVKRDEFYGLHRLYLIASTVQWVAGLAWMWLALRHHFSPTHNSDLRPLR